jgi:RHS repeat-associated protein
VSYARAVLSFGLLVVATLCPPGAAANVTASPAMPGAGSNHAIPNVSPPPRTPLFTEDPSDAEFLRAGLSQEPLVPAWATTTQENRDLAAALRLLQSRKSAGAVDDFQPLEAFLADHSRSAWGPSLLLSLGILYRRTGHLSKALDAWQSAWDSARTLDGAGRAVGDSALARLSQFEAYLGRKELLAPLLSETRHRRLRGSASELVLESQKGLDDMLERPERSFRCGPLALERVLLSENTQAPKESFETLNAAESTPEGLSLSSVAALSAKAGMNYQMVFRAPGAQIVVPAVMHWKVGHYAAIVGRPDGRYQVEDATFGESIRITAQTVDEEASGYFLVPSGPLPAGWRAVGKAEGDAVWGRGDTGTNKDNGATGPPDDNAGPCGGCTSWNVELSVVGLELHDAPVGYTPALGPPVFFQLYYSHRDVLQPQTFSYVNFGPKWTTTWLSYVVDSGNGSVDLYRRGGGDEPYTFDSSPTVSDPGPYSQAVLTTQQDSGGNTTGFTRQLKDGSVETFSLAQGTQYFMTSVADPQGNAVTIRYDAQMRISSLVDAVGQVTTITYGLATDPLKVTQVTDPFGRSATFTYTADGSHLASITDVLGITSSYTYGTSHVGAPDAGNEGEDGGDDAGDDAGSGFDGDFITTLTTPYGTTTFAAGDNDVTMDSQRYLTVTDALGRVSHYEFVQAPHGSHDSDPAVPAGMETMDTYLQYRNTYVWDAQQYAAAMSSGKLDYTTGKIYHWLHTLDDSTSRVVESTKQPLENRVWYDYPGQSSGSIYVGTSNTPLHAGRVLDDGKTTQLRAYTYNSLGKVTQSVDPAGRALTMTYASNGIDLLTVTNTTNGANDVLVTYTYNDQHEPVTRVGANGATTQYAYNALGQIVKKTDASGHVTTYAYANSHLTSVQGPLGATYALTWDSAGRIASVTDAGGETVTYTYDAADRLIGAAFPDGTSTKFAYALLDLASVTDRLGNTTTYAHDAERETTQIKDALGHTVALAYNRGGKLSSITDENGHVTKLGRDAQERVTAKTLADGTTTALAYEATTSRLLSVTDALGQIATRTNNVDDSLGGVTYSNAHAATAAVGFTYDPAYPRLTSMTDGTGTTSYAYYPVTPPAAGASLLKSVTSPIAGSSGATDTVSYAYDLLDRMTGRTTAGSTETWGYDASSRMTGDSNALDAFAIAYADPTPRISGITSKNGPTVAMTYFGPTGDERLQEMTFTSGTTQLSQFSYAYEAEGNVSTFTQKYLGQKLAATGGGAAPGGPTGGMIPSLLEARKSRPASDGARTGGPWGAVGIGAAALALALAWAGRATRGGQRVLAITVFALGLVLVANCGGGPNGGAPNDGGPSDVGPGDGHVAEAGGDAATAPTAQVSSYAYDSTLRLVSAAVGTNVSMPSSPQYAYAYDSASNLTSIAANAPAQVIGYSSTNAIAAGTYDANGSPTALGAATYSWDAQNRLFSATVGANESDFSYDGMGRVVRIVQKQGANTVSDRAYTWCGNSRCVEHDNTQPGSPISKQYFAEGVVAEGTGYYYVFDLLGSVRQLVDGTGKIRAQYDYDAYGNQTKVSGDEDSDVGYTGYFKHAATGLDLALLRAYDPAHGRWLNRDPIGEWGGWHLYEYVGDDPVTLIDPTGKFGISAAVAGGVVGAVVAGGGAYLTNGGDLSGAVVAGAIGGLGGAIGGGLGADVGFGLQAGIGAATGALGALATQGGYASLFAGTLAGAGAGALNGLPGVSVAGGAVVGGLLGIPIGLAGGFDTAVGAKPIFPSSQADDSAPLPCVATIPWL